MEPFSSKEYAEIHIQSQFVDNEKGIWKILLLRIKMVGTYFDAPSKTLKS
jgi:hypothetical protein